MRQPAGTWFLIAIVAAALAACSTPKPSEVDPNVFPATFKKDIVDTLINTLDDPTNVRDAYISEPALAPVANDQRYVVCVRYNARDANRHYMGSSDHVAYFFAGHLNQFVDATKEQCGKAAYKPFPDLEKICLGAGAKCL